MRTLLLSGFLVLLLSSILSQSGTDRREIEKELKEANRLYLLTDPTPETDSLALRLFTRVADRLRGGGIDDSIAADCLIRAANIRQGYQQFNDANDFYYQALSRGHRFPPVRYEAWLYLGSSHYFNNMIDSAQIYFERASQLVAAPQRDDYSFPELDRLYNSLGAIYFESANYKQAQNYFEQAKRYTSPEAADYGELITGIESNIANCYMKQNRFDTALQILRSLQPSASQREIIRQNMAHAFFELGRHDSAMAIYNTLQTLTGYNRIIALNNTGRILMARGDWERAEQVFDSSIAGSRQAAAGIRNKEEALAYLYRSRLAGIQGLTDEAISWVNEGLREIHLNFEPRHWRDIPDDITQSVSPVTLFQILQEKASLLWQKYRQTGQTDYLEACLDAFRKTMQTSRFIRINFDNDEARLFFLETSQPLFRGALAAAYEAGVKGMDYEDHFLYALENYKGTILNQHLQSIELKPLTAVPDHIRTREKELKQLLAFYVSRINRSAGEADAKQMQEKLLEIQVELSRLQKAYDADATYQLYKYQQVQKEYTVAAVQRQLPASTALLHYYADDSLLYVMAISGQKTAMAKIDDAPLLTQELFSFLQALTDQTEGQRFSAHDQAIALYKKLLQPVRSVLNGCKKWTIIPDGPLFYLPFEALAPTEKADDYLVLSKTISYHYSIELLLEKSPDHETRWNKMNALGFAPFSQQQQDLIGAGWTPLPESREELPLQSLNFLGRDASKHQFLDKASGYPLIHLATHASLGSDSSSNYIQFFPLDSQATQHRLFVPEIYNLDLRQARLIILSACETGGGQQLTGEGLLSLSRAFLYAGAEGIMATLWKTEDRVAGYLMQRVHQYLKKGSGPASALQKAKADLIADPGIPFRYKTPNYWSNFIYVGKPEKSGRSYPLLIIIISFAVLLSLALLWRYRYKTGT